MTGLEFEGRGDDGDIIAPVICGLDFRTLMYGAVADWPGTSDRALRRAGK
jgi:hypothetical protein